VRQLLQVVTEALLELGQQPAFLQSALPLRPTRGAVQHQSLGFRHRPDNRFDGVSPQLLQGGHALVAIDHHMAIRLVLQRNDYDRSLLAGAAEGSE